MGFLAEHITNLCFDLLCTRKKVIYVWNKSWYVSLTCGKNFTA